ncbi:uncharacterized protein LOC115456454 isoform X2 [Manduca sexta]|uniref:Atos-like conserved domain-containing protein n=1 Tax=Manduca sexta TaxID=7130 RepID=A0A921YSD7_MANSE|nr:uncharacterized protein LOC115456454 isoform X2 [Manduca sexta]KAG6444310.1 hypothetical protein O3G_MSEX003343 [Manduca sexta]
MFCLFGVSECFEVLETCSSENAVDTMHSCETAPAPVATGPTLLLQLGRLIIRARSTSPASRAPLTAHAHAQHPQHDRLLHAKLLASKPSTSQQVQTQPKADNEEPKTGVEAQLSDHVQALWNEHLPVCIEVLLAPDCSQCYNTLSGESSPYEPLHAQRGLLLERWTMQPLVTKSHETPTFTSSQWLLNAVRSQLHFSQLAAWLARLKETKPDDNPTERRRKLSREKCNYKKLEANCDETELPNEQRKLNVVYSVKMPGETYKMAEFTKPPNDHQFPMTEIGDNVYLKVVLQSLPRLDDIPTLKCGCQKRRPSKELPVSQHEELVGKLNDLTIGSSSPNTSTQRLLDDRMMTPCTENGKHKCSCDDESDGKEKTKRIDERRLKEIAKCKRRWRKESKLKKLNDSTSSESEQRTKETHTSIPILQAARFDRLRAIGCYRNQTYLTLPASRLDTRSPFTETEYKPDGVKKTNTVGTQTDDVTCQCGAPLKISCESCDRGMVRSDGNYDLASIDNGARRKCEDDFKQYKKHKCDIQSNICDSSLIKRPKLRRFFPIVDRIDRVVSDRQKKDMEELHLKTDDTVFSGPKETKRQKTFSISDDDYVLYEKCDYGTFDKYEIESPGDETNGFKFPDAKDQVRDQVPSPSEVDRFRWRFDSAASMVFHSKTGLPLTSSPAPLRRGNNCFDFDDSINGISGIKSALFHPISPPSPAPPASPASPASPAPAPRITPPPQPKKEDTPKKLRMGPSAGLLGSFEESALKGRLEPVATVHGFSAELGASGAFCPPHKRLPVTVFFYAPGGTNAPYMGHINLGAGGYRVSRSGTVQVSLFNPHGTLVKMFVVLYDLRGMPPLARTFLRQRTLYLPPGAAPPPPHTRHKWLRYLIHLRFMTSKSGKLYLHTDIRILVSRKADLDTATAHSAIFRPLAAEESQEEPAGARAPRRVFGGCGPGEALGGAYELRSFTDAPDNPRYSPR